ncbi:DUF1931 family protein [Pseudonocardia bannensis]|uniref:DUF1931 family protein n=1 Tax=Pseudonocardia bannensis TaxID=630973 RepID=A0A848DJL0_9PSEU|nr:DUF1931 family protein [Pseudonocardia bannensis]NMH92716.1 DUF1931 family protein [Pseudonocardia bannensis]
MAVSGTAQFERFFRSVAGIDVDKEDLRRFHEFIDEKVDDMALAGSITAKWNGRDVVQPPDLPITKGVQERIREFDRLEEAEEILPLLRQMSRRPPDVTFADETEERLVHLYGGLSVGLARTFRVIDPEMGNPSTEDWDRAFQLFRLLT